MMCLLRWVDVSDLGCKSGFKPEDWIGPRSSPDEKYNLLTKSCIKKIFKNLNKFVSI